MSSLSNRLDARRYRLSVGAAIAAHAALGALAWGTAVAAESAPQKSMDTIEIALTRDQQLSSPGDAMSDTFSQEDDATGGPVLENPPRGVHPAAKVAKAALAAPAAVPKRAAEPPQPAPTSGSEPIAALGSPPEPATRPAPLLARAQAAARLAGAVESGAGAAGAGAGKEQAGGPTGTMGGGTAAGAGRGRAPRLLATGDPCRGMFPYEARQDRGTVTVALRVGDTGVPTKARVLAEYPSGQGFGGAARACARHLMFEPATNAFGQAVSGQSVVRLRFARQ